MEIKRPRLYRGGKPKEWAIGTAAYGAGGIVFLSGSTGRDPSKDVTVRGMEAQTRVALEHIKKSLEDFGTSLENILHIWYYMPGPFPHGLLSDPKNMERERALEKFWKENCPDFCQEKNPPASTLLGVECLAYPELLVEITVVAAIP